MPTAGGLAAFVLLLVAFVANVGLTIFASYWLSRWLDDVQRNTTTGDKVPIYERDDTTFYLTVYACTLGLLLFSAVFKAIAFVRVSQSGVLSIGYHRSANVALALLTC